MVRKKKIISSDWSECYERNKKWRYNNREWLGNRHPRLFDIPAGYRPQPHFQRKFSSFPGWIPHPGHPDNVIFLSD